MDGKPAQKPENQDRKEANNRDYHVAFDAWWLAVGIAGQGALGNQM